MGAGGKRKSTKRKKRAGGVESRERNKKGKKRSEHFTGGRDKKRKGQTIGGERGKPATKREKKASLGKLAKNLRGRTNSVRHDSRDRLGNQSAAKKS